MLIGITNAEIENGKSTDFNFITTESRKYLKEQLPTRLVNNGNICIIFIVIVCFYCFYCCAAVQPFEGLPNHCGLLKCRAEF